MKLDEVAWCVVSGLYNMTLIINFRNSGLCKVAGRVAQDFFGKYGGSAGGQREATQVERPLARVIGKTKGKNVILI